ncbi:MAG TPA: hypothetical protein VGB91_05480 [Rhizomicrobium sp.]
MNLDDILAQQKKLLDKAKTSIVTQKIAQADLAQPIDPKLLTIQNVFEGVEATGSRAALAARYQAAIAQRQPQLAQIRQGVSQDPSLKAVLTSPSNLVVKNLTAALRKSGAIHAPVKAPTKINAVTAKKSPKRR